MFRVIKTAKELQDLFSAYVEDNKTKGYIKRDNVKSGENAGQVIEHLVPKPLSVEAFCLFAGIHSLTFKQWCADATEHINEMRDSESTIEEYLVSDKVSERGRNKIEICIECSRIRESINASLTGGGVAGLYNPSLVAAIVGLKNTEEEHNLNSRKAADINININGKSIDLC